MRSSCSTSRSATASCRSLMHKRTESAGYTRPRHVGCEEGRAHEGHFRNRRHSSLGSSRPAAAGRRLLPTQQRHASRAAGTPRSATARPGASQDPDCNLIATADGGCGRSPNIDDGNLNYRDDLFSRAFKAVTEVSVQRGNFGAFVRGSALYDVAGDGQATRIARRSAQARRGSGRQIRAPARCLRLRALQSRQHARGAAARPAGA